MKANGSYGAQSDFVDLDVNLDELPRLGELEPARQRKLSLQRSQAKGEDTSVLNNRILRVADREIRVEGEMPQF